MGQDQEDRIALCTDSDCPASRDCRRFLEARYDRASFLRGQREPGWVKCRHFMFAPGHMRLEPAE
jgi:hypothetical protein